MIIFKILKSPETAMINNVKTSAGFTSLLISAFLVATLLQACANSNTIEPTLSDLGTRYWKGTIYLSVSEQAFSIQCDINPNYQTLADIPVRYKNKDAEGIFTRSDDKAKIKALKQQCLDRSVK